MSIWKRIVTVLFSRNKIIAAATIQKLSAVTRLPEPKVV